MTNWRNYNVMKTHFEWIFVSWYICTELLPHANVRHCSKCYHNKRANTCSFISLATSVVTACTVYRQVGSFFAARASFVSLTATERAPGLDLRVGKSDSPHFESRGKGASSSVRQSSSGKAFQSFVIHFGMPPLTSLWTCLALQGNGEGSRAFCIVVRGKQGSDSHDRHSPRSGRGEDPAQRWTRGVVIGHMREAEQQKDLMSTRRPPCFARL